MVYIIFFGSLILSLLIGFCIIYLGIGSFIYLKELWRINKKNKVLKHCKNDRLTWWYQIWLIPHKYLNNGWRCMSTIKDFEKNESFNRFPGVGRYDIIIDGEIIYDFWYGGNISDDAYVENKVTHFIKYKRYKLPRFIIFKQEE